MSRQKIIHVNKHVIASNRKSGEDEPMISAKTYRENRYGHVVEIRCPDCEASVAKVVSSDPEEKVRKQRSCGARVWVETCGEVDIYERRQLTEHLKGTLT